MHPKKLLCSHLIKLTEIFLPDPLLEAFFFFCHEVHSTKEMNENSIYMVWQELEVLASSSHSHTKGAHTHKWELSLILSKRHKKDPGCISKKVSPPPPVWIRNTIKIPHPQLFWATYTLHWVSEQRAWWEETREGYSDFQWPEPSSLKRTWATQTDLVSTTKNKRQ